MYVYPFSRNKRKKVLGLALSDPLPTHLKTYYKKNLKKKKKKTGSDGTTVDAMHTKNLHFLTFQGNLNNKLSL